jgi:ABC-type uncharacterized transport system permease subunit
VGSESKSKETQNDRGGSSTDLRKVSESVILVLIGFGVAGIVIQVAGYSAPAVFGALLNHSIGSPLGLSSVLWEATSLTMTGLAATVAFRAGIFNIGVEGQAYLGGFMGFLVGYYLSLPSYIELPIVVVAGAVGGILWAIVPAALKAYRGVNEVVTTIMMNYIGSYLVSYLQVLYKSPYSNSSYTSQVNPSAQFSQLFSWGPLDSGIFVSLLTLGAIYFVVWHTTIGYQIRVSGLNPFAARYAGVDPKRMTLFVMLLSGGLAGIGGALFTNASVIGHFDLGTITGVGLNGITVSLIGQLNPIGTFFAAMLVGSLVAATPFIFIAAQLPPQIVPFVTGIIVAAAAIPGLITTVQLGLRRWRSSRELSEAPVIQERPGEVKK